MNLDSWKSLPENLQETITEISNRHFDETAAGLWDSQNQAALDWIQENFDIEFFELDQDETAAWIEETKVIQDNYVNKLEKKGLSGEEFLNRVVELAEQYGSNASE